MADVICPGCRGRYHETTDAFDPEAPPNGTMFRLKDQYGPQGYHWSSFAPSLGVIGALLVCPNCDVPYVGNSGRVMLDGEVEPKQTAKVEPETTNDTGGNAYVCPECGKFYRRANYYANHVKTCKGGK